MLSQQGSHSNGDQTHYEASYTSPSYSLLSPRSLSPSFIVLFSLTLPSAVPSSFLSLLHSLTFLSVLSPQLPSPSPFSFLSFQFLFPSPSKLPSLLPSLLLLAINKYISCCTTSSLLPVFRKCLNQMLNLYAGEQNTTHIHHHTGVHVPHTLVTMCVYVTFPRWSNTSTKGKCCFVCRT